MGGRTAYKNALLVLRRLFSRSRDGSVLTAFFPSHNGNFNSTSLLQCNGFSTVNLFEKELKSCKDPDPDRQASCYGFSLSFELLRSAKAKADRRLLSKHSSGFEGT